MDGRFTAMRSAPVRKNWGAFCMVKQSLNENELISKVQSQFQVAINKADVKVYLRNIPYYDWIKGYNGSLLKNNNGQFNSNISLRTLYQIHLMDAALAKLMLGFSIEAEKHFKSVLGEIVTPFGTKPEIYLKESKYSSKNTAVLSKLRKTIEDDVNLDFSYAQEKFGNIPAWYLAQHVTLGAAINWYARLTTTSKRMYVRNFLEASPLRSIPPNEWLEVMRAIMAYVLEMRNKAAHGKSFITLKVDTLFPSRWINQIGYSDYFKFTKTGALENNLINYIGLLILITDVPDLAVNMLTEFNAFLLLNSHDNSETASLGYDAYTVLNISEHNIDALKLMINKKFGI